MISSKEAPDVNIFNLRSDSNTASDEKGNFTIFVKVGDTLQFQSVQVETKKIALQTTDVSKSLFVVTLLPKVINLDEVEIPKYDNINAVALGILDKPAKKYTPAERKLRTAEELHWYSPLLIPVGGMSFDGMLNAISGRTAMLKKELEIERKEKMMVKIEAQFNEEYFTENLKIPQEYYKGFLYYIVDDSLLIDHINSKDKNKAKFRMSELATQYLELLKQADKQ